ncbi:MAG: heavy metal translocating P-type ATPase [Lachnospiraceae bacterium]|nr:heavy metal translocating P-type ATPase [Lachnospiraceae bacterium]
MTSKQKKSLYRIIIAAVIFFPLLVAEHMGRLDELPVIIRFAVFLVPYLIVGFDVLHKAVVNISHGQVFDESFLMMIATFGAFGVKEYEEAVAVMLFYQIGELFQSYAVGKSRQSISELMDMAPEYANLEDEEGIHEVEPDDVEVGSTIVVKPGERVPLDGEVIEGSSMLDTSALTGESVPRRISVGEPIYSGCINGEGTLKVVTTKEYDDSTVARILELVENAGEKKARVENFITRFARYYTPVVTFAAIALVLLGPVVSGGGMASVSSWLLRACTFLVVSCPCALVISVPLGFFGGIGAASRQGILVKGSNYLELISRVDTFVFDKTGTLTKGEFRVSKVIGVAEDNTGETSDTAAALSKEEILYYAAHAEGYSTHPIAASIRKAYCEQERNKEHSAAVAGNPQETGISGNTEEGILDLSGVEGVTEEAGHGISAVVDGKPVLVGNSRLLKAHGISFKECGEYGTVVYLAVDNVYAGVIVISDTVKDGAAEAVKHIREAGGRSIMLTGDREEAAGHIASELKIDEYYAQLLPADKVARVEELLSNKKDGKYLAFSGDGINDAPVLARADIGIAMGAMGSDAAIEAADIVLMDDDVGKIGTLIRIAGRTMSIVKQNIVFAIGVKVLVLLLSAAGIANMWAAVFADVGVCVLAILNSMRMLRDGADKA